MKVRKSVGTETCGDADVDKDDLEEDHPRDGHQDVVGQPVHVINILQSSAVHN